MEATLHFPRMKFVHLRGNSVSLSLRSLSLQYKIECVVVSSILITMFPRWLIGMRMKETIKNKAYVETKALLSIKAYC